MAVAQPNREKRRLERKNCRPRRLPGAKPLICGLLTCKNKTNAPFLKERRERGGRGRKGAWKG